MADNSFSMTIGDRYISVGDIIKQGSQYKFNTFAFEENLVHFFHSDAEQDIDSTSQLIQKLLQDAGIRKKAVNIVIPDTYSYSQIIEMPILTEKELLSAIKYQADQFIPLPIDQVNLDIEVLYENKKTKKVSLLLVASPLSVLDKIIAVVENAGLAPTVIENEASALFRLISDINENQQSQNNEFPLILFINMGYTSTSLYLYHRQLNIVLQIHNFSLGYTIFSKDIQANLNTSEVDTKKLLETIGFSEQQTSYNIGKILSSPLSTIVEEIERFVVSSKSRFNTPIASALLLGEGSGIFSLDKKLSDSVGISVARFDMTQYCIQNNVFDFFKNAINLFIPTIGASIRS